MHIVDIPSLGSTIGAPPPAAAVTAAASRPVPAETMRDPRGERRLVLAAQQSLQALADGLQSSTDKQPPGSELVVEDLIREFHGSLRSLFDNSQLIAKPGPVLKVLRESIRSAVTNVFNQRGPGFIPPFRFGFNFPPEPEPWERTDEASAAEMVSMFVADPAQFRDVMLGDSATGIAPALDQLLTAADAQIAPDAGDVGIFLDVSA